MPNSTVASRAKSFLSCREPFGLPAEKICRLDMRVPTREQHILRMMVRTPTSGGFKVPLELHWLIPAIAIADNTQAIDGIGCRFVYLTVRSGPVKSVTDDLWHVDGFSMRVPHAPEQNYIWTNIFGTELLDQEIVLPKNFDPLKHNIHTFFQDVADEKNVRILARNTLWRIDPYVVHRRPQVPKNVWRTFFRISYVPIEIEDDTCTINPLIPREKPYGRQDIRRNLERYQEAA